VLTGVILTGECGDLAGLLLIASTVREEFFQCGCCLDVQRALRECDFDVVFPEKPIYFIGTSESTCSSLSTSSIQNFTLKSSVLAPKSEKSTSGAGSESTRECAAAPGVRAF